MITSIRMHSCRRRSRAEFVARMVPLGEDGPDGDPTQFAGERIVERFGRPRVHRRFLLDSDLRPEFREHRGSARYVAGQMDLGRPGTFTVGPEGYFKDYHGGNGLRVADDIHWFTEAALRRGIGWYFIQTYLYAGRPIGRFKIIRIFSTRGGGRLTVTKLPLR